MNTIFTIPVLALLSTGCATAPHARPVSIDHPASPDAQPAPMPGPSETLQNIDTISKPLTDAPSTGGMGGMNMGGMHDMTPPAASPAATTQSSAAFVCPMHPEVTSGKPGSCPECGMKLVKNDQGGMTGGAHDAR